MVIIRYHSYNCQVCGRPTNHQLFVLQCQSCGLAMCKKCAKGSFCLECFNSLPEELQKKYKKQLALPKIIVSTILLAIAIPLGIFNPGLLLFLALMGIIAYCMDHGRYKTTPKSAVRKAQKIVAELRQQTQPITQYGPNNQNTQNNTQQQNSFQPNDPNQKYDGTFWEN